MIFLTPSEHKKIHWTGKNNPNYGKNLKGDKNPMYGKNAEDFMTPEAILLKRKKQSDSMKGRHRVYREDGTHYYA